MARPTAATKDCLDCFAKPKFNRAPQGIARSMRRRASLRGAVKRTVTYGCNQNDGCGSTLFSGKNSRKHDRNQTFAAQRAARWDGRQRGGVFSTASSTTGPIVLVARRRDEIGNPRRTHHNSAGVVCDPDHPTLSLQPAKVRATPQIPRRTHRVRLCFHVFHLAVLAGEAYSLLDG